MSRQNRPQVKQVKQVANRVKQTRIPADKVSHAAEAYVIVTAVWDIVRQALALTPAAPCLLIVVVIVYLRES